MVLAGDNGSGKSSLCSALFPWPVDKSNVDAGGMVSRTWDHNNSTYIDEYSNGQYSFTKDGTELNAGGGLRTQESLFTEHFGVDIAAMRLLTGESRFTSMSVKQRQYWMSRLDGHQLEKLEAAVSKLKDLKKEKDILLTYNNGQLGKYQVDGDYEEMISRRDKLKVRLDEMFAARVNVPTKPDEYKNTISVLKTEIRRNVVYKKALRTELKYVRDQDLDNLVEQLTTAKLTRQVKLDRLMAISHTAISIEGLPSPDECSAAIQSLEGSMAEIPPEYDHPEVYTKWLYLSADIYKAFDALSELEHLLSVDEGTVCTNAMEIDEAIRNTSSELVRLEENIRLATEDLHNPITCPNCNTSFGKHLGVGTSHTSIECNQQTVLTLKGYQNELHEKRKQVQHTLANVQLIKRIKVYIEDKLNGLLPSLGDIVIASFPNIHTCISSMACIMAALEQSNANAKLRTEMAKYTGYLTLHAKFAQQMNDSAAIEAKGLEQEVTDITERIVLLTKIIQDKQRYNTILAHKESTAKNIATLCSKTLPIALQSILLTGLNDAVTTTALDIRQELNSVIHQLSIYEANKEHHASISAAIVELTTELNHVTEALIILDGKKGFIGTMYKERSQQHIDALNVIISGLYSQDMHVMLPPEAMTFRFPISVEGTVRDDANCGSKGMQEIIDIAFCLLVRQACHMNHLPLILDEVGSALDAGNLDKTYSFLLSCPVDQLVLVSHLTELQSAVSDDQADYIVLSTMNLSKYTLPSTSNACLTFT
jgi:ABC-type molybdenum transport system ATPase subunit/photorepair protein PhrA